MRAANLQNNKNFFTFLHFFIHIGIFFAIFAMSISSKMKNKKSLNKDLAAAHGCKSRDFSIQLELVDGDRCFFIYQ